MGDRHLWIDAPVGLSLALAALHALSTAAGHRISRQDLLPLARDLEARIMGVPTGLQDHYAAAYGGLSVLHLRAGGPRREQLRAGALALARRVVLVLVGASRLSARTNWAMLSRAIDGDPETLERFRDVARAARDMRTALLGGAIDRAAEALSREYAARRGLAPGVETDEMRSVHAAATSAGTS